MKRILIFYKKSSLKPIGGPSGYLYSLMEGLREINPGIQIDLLEDENSYLTIKKKNNVVKRLIRENLEKFYLEYERHRRVLYILCGKYEKRLDLSNYAAVHFHTTMDMFIMRDTLKEYHGQVILTSHSPEPLSMEMIADIHPLFKIVYGGKYKELIDMDRYAFRRADYIVFPNMYADEPYAMKWREYCALKEYKKSQYKYVLTGTIPAKVYQSKEAIRKRYGIPQDAFVISYVGRHNVVKGFDQLKSVGRVLLKRYRNIWFIVGGWNAPIK